MSALEAAAAAECERVSSMESDISLADGISLLTACTAAWSSPTATVFCFGTITAICLVSETDRETLGAAGAIHAIVTTMSEVTEHGTVNEYITAQGCFALCMLAYDNSVNADDIVLSTGGLDVILSAMTLYPADSVVQVAACSALVYITSVASREALWVIHDSVAVELLKLAKRNHPHEVEGEDSVLYWADKALDILAVKVSPTIMYRRSESLIWYSLQLEAVAFDYCWYVDRMEVVTRDDAIVFVSASTASQSSPAVADCFLDTIARACMFNDVNRATFGAVGAIPAVISTMVAHGVRNSTIAANGLVALSSLPSKANARNADAIVLSAGGLDAIHSMMVSHPTDEIVQLSACVALGTLAEAVGPKALSVMRKGRTRELLKIAMKKHPKEGRNNVRYWANQALANL